MNMVPDFQHPGLLWLLLLVPAVWFLPRPQKDLRHGIIRSLVIVALVLGLARPLLRTEEPTPRHVVVIDRSASVDADDLARIDATTDDLVASLAASGEVSLVSYGGARPEVAPELKERLGTSLHLGGEPESRGGLMAALERAALLVPEGTPGSITLATDGNAVDSVRAPILQSLSARGLPVNVVPLADRSAAVRPVSLVALEPLRVGQTGRLAVVVAGGPATCDVEILREDRVVARRAGLRVEGRTTAVLELTPEASGFFLFHARVRAGAGGGAALADRLPRVLAVQDPLRVLHLGGRMAGSGERFKELAGSGFDVDVQDDPEATLPDPTPYDLVVLDDRPAGTVPESWQERLKKAVVDQGTGLVMTGGSGSFGPGGWHDTVVEELLPVELVQKEEKKDPSTALAVIIDTSGSMGGQRIILAKEVTRLALRRLLPHDKVGIVEFYGNKRWAAPLQSAANAINIQRALNRLDAGGGTVILPAIEEAYYGLKNVQTRYKHVLILTDAGVETGAFEPLLRRMAKDGICISTVLVGPGRHSEFLVELADWGNGRYYNASDRFNLPEVILKQPSTARLPAWRPGPHAVQARGGSGWFGDVDLSAMPSLDGYVETRSRSGSEVLLETRSEKHPLLATWHYGLGRVTTFASEPTGSGTEAWSKWSDYPSLLGRVLQRTAAEGRMPFRYRISRRGQRVRVAAERLRGQAARPSARRIEVGERALEFTEFAPGHFEADWTVSPEEEVRVEAGVAGLGDFRWRLVADAASDRAGESNVDPRARLDLAALAAATGGTKLDVDALASFSPRAGGSGRPQGLRDLTPWFLLLALISFLGDLAWRRSRFAQPVESDS